ncbi:hypothetical protein [Legionella impletisoli]|uniref:DH domain-containing protein n=1 Tax=Legionella impletisoli TaxID=343510 RepID=A0A917N8F2_9GAMM|nr:hypothetical protein [Legionella impletisoli]GGI77363.1 hypothetical protein GCM10007966_02640 [Legionella impletisoli]
MANPDLQELLSAQALLATNWFEKQKSIIKQTYPLPIAHSLEEVDERQEKLHELNKKLEKTEITALHNLNEFFAKERIMIANIDKLRTILSSDEVQKELHKLDPKEQQFFKQYLNQLTELIDAYQTINFHKPLANPSASTDEVVNEMESLITSKQFKDYTARMIPLILDFPELQKMNNKKITQALNTQSYQFSDRLSFEARAVIPVQHIMRYQLQLNEIVNTLNSFDKLIKESESIESLSSLDARMSLDSNLTPLSIPSRDTLSRASTTASMALERAIEIASVANIEKEKRDVAELALREIASEAYKHPEVMLQKILELNLNSPNQRVNGIATKHFDVYLKTILSTVYRDQFSLPEHSEELEVNSENKILIYEALGITNFSEPIDRIEPSLFKPESLDKLYTKNKNPLWLVLKSTKPIDETFSAEDKIKTLQQLAEVYKAGKMGKTEKYLGAYELAKTAYAIAEQYPEAIALAKESFGPQSPLGTWIIKKHEEHKKPKEALQAALFLSDVRNLVRQDESILPSKLLEIRSFSISPVEQSAMEFIPISTPSESFTPLPIEDIRSEIQQEEPSIEFETDLQSEFKDEKELNAEKTLEALKDFSKQYQGHKDKGLVRFCKIIEQQRMSGHTAMEQLAKINQELLAQAQKSPKTYKLTTCFFGETPKKSPMHVIYEKFRTGLRITSPKDVETLADTVRSKTPSTKPQMDESPKSFKP